MDQQGRADVEQYVTRGGTTDLQALHDAVVLGDAVMADTLVRLALPRVCASLRPEWPGIALAMVEEAVEDAILWYLANPTRYDPARSGLHTFLHLVARRKLMHAIRSERRRLAREVPTGLFVPDSGPGSPNPTWRGMSEGVDDPTGPAGDLSQVLALAMSDAERQFVLARASGASTSALASIIGAGHSPDEQRRAVHRVMARLRQRAKRRPSGAIRHARD